MHGPIQRLIESRGQTYTVRNADRSGGDRDTPTYRDDGTVTAVLERGQSRPDVHVDSDGSNVQTDTQLRFVGEAAIREEGDADGYPTRLEHPDGQAYEVVASSPEDSGVTVLSVERA
jgi:hypothetical protein